MADILVSMDVLATLSRMRTVVNKSIRNIPFMFGRTGSAPLVAALCLFIALSRPADAATLTLTDGFSGFGLFDRITVAPSSAGGFAPPAVEFNRTFSIDRFDPNLGVLNSVDLSWQMEGEIQVGLFPNGPSFEGGSGFVSALSSLTLFMALGVSPGISEIEVINASHTGSIGGRPGFGSTSVSSAQFTATGAASYDSGVDLGQFTGVAPIMFESTLAYLIVGTVTDPGPSFGVRPSRLPDVDVSITYNFTPFPDDPEAPGPTTDIPEPASLSLLGAGLLGLTWVRRRTQKPQRERAKSGQLLPALAAATWRGGTRS